MKQPTAHEDHFKTSSLTLESAVNMFSHQMAPRINPCTQMKLHPTILVTLFLPSLYSFIWEKILKVGW